MNLYEAFDKIKYLTGRTDDDLLLLSYEVGVSLVELIEEGDKELVGDITRSKLFWNWYLKQFGMLTREFLETKEETAWPKIGSDQVWNRYTDFVHLLKVCDTGTNGYCYLVGEVLEPDFRKRRKADVTIS